jgi:hypothetical protein
MKINELIDEEGRPIKPDWKVGLTPEEIKQMEDRLRDDPDLQFFREARKEIELRAKKYED